MASAAVNKPSTCIAKFKHSIATDVIADSSRIFCLKLLNKLSNNFFKFSFVIFFDLIACSQQRAKFRTSFCEIK